MVVRAPGQAARDVVTEQPVRPLGFEDDEALLPFGARSFQGYRLLHEYFAFPARFLSVELRGLKNGVKTCAGRELEVVLLVDRHDPVLESSVSASFISLFCTPAINLFPRKADSIHLSERVHEYHIVPDRNRAARSRDSLGDRGRGPRFGFRSSPRIFAVLRVERALAQ